MRVRFNPNAKNELKNFDRFISSKEELQALLKKDENKNKKIYIEIGMGKGDFISTLASLDKDNIYIGIELVESILALAVKKLKRNEETNNIEINNLYFMSFDAEELSKIFEENQIEKIYLNFSDPWPKSRHEKRRLTYKSFLEEYKRVLKKDGIIEFKTDNRILFEFSLVSMQNFGLEFLEVYLDLHKSNIYNVMTEYEGKFSEKGPIYKLVCKIKK